MLQKTKHDLVLRADWQTCGLVSGCDTANTAKAGPGQRLSVAFANNRADVRGQCRRKADVSPFCVEFCKKPNTYPVLRAD